MKDLEVVLNKNLKLFNENKKNMPILDELILGTKWVMSIDKEENISLALRIGKEASYDEFVKFIKALINKPIDYCIKKSIDEGENFREIAVSLLNLMSKSFNSTDFLKTRNILKTDGLNFNYDVSNKKVGLIGYGVYTDFFLDKCSEFHAFDFRSERNIITTFISNSSRTYPKNIIWHLEKSALEYKDILKTLDIVIMTGSTVVNNSYIDILNSCPNAEIKGIYGPSCEMNPEYFFDLGYNYIFSTNIRNKNEYLDSLIYSDNAHKEFNFMDLYELKKI